MDKSKIINYFLVNESDYIEVLNNKNFRISKIKDKKIIISGGSGFLGKWLIGTLLNLNNIYLTNLEIYIISRHPNKFIKKNYWIKREKKIKIIKFDLSKEDLDVKKKFDYFFHFANDPSGDKYSNLEHQLNYNLQINKNIIKFCQKNIKNKIFFSSSGAAGKIINNNVLNFSNSYGLMKYLSERLFLDNIKINNKIIIGRLFTFCGPLLPLKTHLAFNSFLMNILENKNIKIRGNGKAIRSYMYASIMTSCIINLTFGKKHSKKIFDIGSTKRTSIIELAKKMIKISNSNNKLEVKNKIRRELKQIYLPKSDICKILNISKDISLDESIKRSYDNYKKIINSY